MTYLTHLQYVLVKSARFLLLFLAPTLDVLTYFVMFATITDTDRLSIAAAAFSNTYLLHQLLWNK